jgi:multidrug efflux system outer membrane protein
MKLRALTLILLAALTGCTLEPHYARPAPAVSPQWPEITDRYPDAGGVAPSDATLRDTAAVRAADIGCRN